MTVNRRAAFAVLRIDHYLRGTTDDLAELVTVREIVSTQEEAQQEVDRLNRLAAESGREGGIEYVVQHTRVRA